MNKIVLIVLFILGLIFRPSPARCYEQDVHFNLTYYLCSLGGFSQDEAFIIADADQGLDDNDVTSALPDAMSGKIHHLLHPEEAYLWHSLADGGEIMSFGENKGKKAHDGREAATDRLMVLWGRALSPDDAQIAPGSDGLIMKTVGGRTITERKCRQLIKLGQYLHYAQDYYAHRQPGDYAHLDAPEEANWEPYGKELGHARDLHSPDRIPWRINLAKAMARFCYKQICEYRREAFKQEPRYDLSDCIYANEIKNKPFAPDATTNVAQDGMNIIDVIINVFATIYPAPTVQSERPVNPNPKSPASPQGIPDEDDPKLLRREARLLPRMAILFEFTRMSKGKWAGYQLRDAAGTTIFLPVLNSRLMIDQMTYDKSADISRSSIQAVLESLNSSYQNPMKLMSSGSGP